MGIGSVKFPKGFLGWLIVIVVGLFESWQDSRKRK